MSSANLGWLFYKGYYRNLTNDDYLFMLLSKDEKKRRENEAKTLEDTIDKNLQRVITETVTLDEDEMLGNTHFKATTTYPGLILGSGNAHELPDVKGQAILGFSFDYTSGLPVIAGSSVKGVLRSAFKHLEYIQELLESYVDVKALEAEIFDNGDVFFDAVVVASGGSTLLGDDYITPHNKYPLKNPIPLRFIKVMPNVSFRFDFELSSGLISKSKKAKLFQDILADLGLGAKTNVGYGKFDNFKKEQTEEEKELEKLEREEEAFDEAIDSNDLEKLEKFKRDFPNSTRDVDGAIAKIKHENKIADIRTAFNNLDKSKRNHVDTFVKKYQDNPDAKVFIDELNQSKQSDSIKVQSKDINSLDSITSDKEFKAILHAQKAFSDNEKEKVKENILRICNDLNKKKTNKFIRDIKLKKYLGNDFESEIIALLGD